MMIGPIRLLMHLWWCTHIASRHVVFWFAYIPDLGSRSAFVWSIISVLLCQHSFGDVWSCFSIFSLRLCISCSLHHRWAYPSVLYGEIPCLMLVTILHWGIPPSLSSSDFFCRFSHYSIYFLIFMGHRTRAYPLSLSLSDLWRTFPLLDLFLDLCESSYWGIPPLAFFYWGIPPLFGFAMSRADFMIVRCICRSLRVIT